jgi:hypothetical protein
VEAGDGFVCSGWGIAPQRTPDRVRRCAATVMGFWIFDFGFWIEPSLFNPKSKIKNPKSPKPGRLPQRCFICPSRIKEGKRHACTLSGVYPRCCIDCSPGRKVGFFVGFNHSAKSDREHTFVQIASL